MSTATRLRYMGVLLLAVLGAGTIGYHFIEGWNLLDAFYMTVITISTVGYSEVHPLSPMGRAFTSALIIVGVGATFYVLTLFFELLVEGQIRGLLGKRRMERRLRGMKDHYIVCGYGRVGSQVVEELQRRSKRVVVIESRPGRQDELKDKGIHFIPGDATDDKTLRDAGLEYAHGLIVAVPGEAENVLICLTARQINATLNIVGRADEEHARKKLQLAGANTVVCPHELGGKRMAIATVSPNVLDFMKIAGDQDGTGIRIDEIRVATGSKLCGKTLRDSPIKSQLGLTVIGLRKNGREMQVNPAADVTVDADDILIVIGPEDRLGTLRELTAPPL